MNKLEDFNKIIIKNNENKFIVDEFIQYFMYIYTGLVTNNKLNGTGNWFEGRAPQFWKRRSS